MTGLKQGNTPQYIESVYFCQNLEVEIFTIISSSTEYEITETHLFFETSKNQQTLTMG